MNTDQKIREAFEKYKAQNPELAYYYEDFEAGYLALLNSLEPSYLVRDNEMLYRLPEGVTKDD